MHYALGAKNKLAFIDISILVANLVDLNRCAWEHYNFLVHSWILNSVNAQISQTLVLLENANDVWNDLKEIFAKANCIRVSNLCVEFNNLKQESRCLIDYLIEIHGLWEELKSYRVIPTCTHIHQCRREVMRYAHDFRLEDKSLVWLVILKSCTSLWLMVVSLMQTHLSLSLAFIVFSFPNIVMSLVFANNYKGIPNQAIWHFRLAHDMLYKMSQLYPKLLMIINPCVTFATLPGIKKFHIIYVVQRLIISF